MGGIKPLACFDTLLQQFVWVRLLILDKFVDMMLCSVFASGDFKHVGDAQESLVRVTVCHDLQDGEVFQHTVHHVFFWQMLEFVYEVDHVFTHG